jgi:hypothetical protein
MKERRGFAGSFFDARLICDRVTTARISISSRDILAKPVVIRTMQFLCAAAMAVRIALLQIRHLAAHSRSQSLQSGFSFAGFCKNVFIDLALLGIGDVQCGLCCSGECMDHDYPRPLEQA